jgi:hypothetical protein
MECSVNGVPMFGQSGLEYEHWSRKTKKNLQAHGYDILNSLVT